MNVEATETLTQPFFKSLFSIAIEYNLLGPSAVLLSVFLSYYGIVKSINSNRDNVKDRATITYLSERNKDDNFTNSVKLIFEHNNDINLDIKKFAVSEHKAEESAAKIRYIANHYEYLAVGVFNDIYNEAVLKDSTKGTTLKVYEALEGYIRQVRIAQGAPNRYENFEKLANKWKSEDNVKN